MKPTKKAVFEHLLSRGNVWVTFDPRSNGVVVPDHLASDPKLTLMFGYGLNPPIPDIAITEGAVSGTLSFEQRGLRLCVVPWQAVFGLFGDDRRGMIWEESVPNDLVPPREAPLLEWFANPTVPHRCVAGCRSHQTHQQALRQQRPPARQPGRREGP